MLISLCNLAALGKIQKNVQTKVTPVGQINLKTQRNNKYAVIYETAVRIHKNLSIHMVWLVLHLLAV